jgi:hypothetical protein
MRPKTVVIILVLAVAVLGGAVLLKTVLATGGNSEVAVDPPAPAPEQTTSPSNGPAKPPVASIVATTREEDRQARIDKELDVIRDALLEGSTNRVTFAAVLDRLFDPEADVRKAAVETLIHMNDVAAIPKLKEALERIDDMREKAAILEAIDYLKLGEAPPAETANVSDDPPSRENLYPGVKPAEKQKFLRKQK